MLVRLPPFLSPLPPATVASRAEGLLSAIPFESMRPLLLAFALAAVAHAQTDAIQLNQVGFYPKGAKTAVVVGADAGPFVVRPAGGGAAVFTGQLGAAETWGPSGESVRLAAFDGVTAPGEYVVEVEGVGVSHSFTVGDYVHQEVARGALKAYYFMRASTALAPEHAGPWARPAGHPDDRVLVHNSAATASRPTGTVIAAPGGWYDAGDYNKYVVNSGISVGTLLLLMELYPDYVAALDTDVPESGDGVPDLLDEVLVNVRWMLDMQDADGGVYHKLTTANFSGRVMPHQATATRYVVQKSTAATLDFAAVLAQASRIVAAYEDAFPGLADDLLASALDAWDWARAYPSVAYEQWTLSDPAVSTGTYAPGGDDFQDEFDWAAWELHLTTRADSFLTVRPVPSSPNLGTPWWGSVREMGYYSILVNSDVAGPGVDVDAIGDALVGQADWFLQLRDGSAYDVVMGSQSWMWGWGSNSTAANQGLALILAHWLTGDDRYLDGAVDNLDYLLGRNATGYSFLTGFGDRTPVDIHHRPSSADGVAAPVPGLLVGGPNPGQEDGCTYPSSFPARSYVDDWCSYASNEITINWNAPLVFLAAAVEAERSATGLPRPVSSGQHVPEDGLGLRVGPNPARGAAAVRFRLAAPGAVTVRLFDVLGREVARPHDGPLGSGAHTVEVDAAVAPAGVYVVRVETVAATASRPLTFVR